MMKLLRQHHISFKNAFAGLWWAFKTQPNFRVHFFLSACAIALGFYLGITKLEMTIIVFAIILGISSEMINTALESMTDLITTEWRQQAKIAKDVSAGMMLLTAIGAVGIFLLIFIPYFIK